MKHGTLGAYSQGCRCDNCRGFHSRYFKDWRRRNPNSLGGRELYRVKCTNLACQWKGYRDLRARRVSGFDHPCPHCSSPVHARIPGPAPEEVAS